MVVHTIEFHGRLCRADGRPANPGTYDLYFQLFEGREGERAIWEEALEAVPVAAGGFYHVVLGQGVALRPELFKETPRYLGVRVIRAGRPAEETAERVPLTGVTLKLGASAGALDARVGALETNGGAPSGELVGPKTRKRLRVLHRRLRRLESGGGTVGLLATRLGMLEERLARLDGEEGRVTHLEDEMEDLVGPDGDVVDLNERMDRVECRPPELRVLQAPEVAALQERVERLLRRVEELEATLLAQAPDPTVVASPSAESTSARARPRRAP